MQKILKEISRIFQRCKIYFCCHLDNRNQMYTRKMINFCLKIVKFSKNIQNEYELK